MRAKASEQHPAHPRDWGSPKGKEGDRRTLKGVKRGTLLGGCSRAYPEEG